MRGVRMLLEVRRPRPRKRGQRSLDAEALFPRHPLTPAGVAQAPRRECEPPPDRPGAACWSLQDKAAVEDQISELTDSLHRLDAERATERAQKVRHCRAAAPRAMLSTVLRRAPRSAVRPHPRARASRD